MTRAISTPGVRHAYFRRAAMREILRDLRSVTLICRSDDRLVSGAHVWPVAPVADMSLRVDPYDFLVIDDECAMCGSYVGTVGGGPEAWDEPTVARGFVRQRMQCACCGCRWTDNYTVRRWVRVVSAPTLFSHRNLTFRLSACGVSL